MGLTNVRSEQIKNEDIRAEDIQDGAVRGADANGGNGREIALGTVSDVDLRDNAVTPAKLDETGEFQLTELRVGDGSAGNPSLTFTNDLDTGIFSGGVNILGLGTNGSEALRIDSSQNVGLGGSTVTDAILSLNTTTKAFLPPRMTTTQRDAISTPTAGMLIYNTSTDELNLFTSSWGNISAPATAVTQVSGDPVSPAEGDIWYDTSTKQFKGQTDTSIVVLG